MDAEQAVAALIARSHRLFMRRAKAVLGRQGEKEVDLALDAKHAAKRQAVIILDAQGSLFCFFVLFPGDMLELCVLARSFSFSVTYGVLDFMLHSSFGPPPTMSLLSCIISP